MAYSSIYFWFSFVGNLSVELFWAIRISFARSIVSMVPCPPTCLHHGTGTRGDHSFHFYIQLGVEKFTSSSLRFMIGSQFAPFFISLEMLEFRLWFS